MLAWSFNRDGEVQPGLVKDMEKRLNIDLNKKREARQELVPLAKPQMGVNSLSKEFKGTKSIPGVKESAKNNESKYDGLASLACSAPCSDFQCEVIK